MKKITLCMAMLLLAFCVMAQDPVPADKGVSYGTATTPQGAIPVDEIVSNMKNATFTGKATGKVLSVCQERGCWMTIEKSNGETMMVKFKDYGFFMPRNIAGKEVVVDGEASIKETSVKQLKHYAGDAGKTKNEISKITSPKKELVFTARGVLVL